jgi:hypothetical protein
VVESNDKKNIIHALVFSESKIHAPKGIS